MFSNVIKDNQMSALKSFETGVSELCTECILPAVVEHMKGRGVEVTVEELMEAANLPVQPAARKASAVPKPRTRARTTKPDLDQGTCVFPVQRGDNKGKPCGKKIKDSPCKYYCTACTKKACFRPVLTREQSLPRPEGIDLDEVAAPQKEKSNKGFSSVATPLTHESETAPSKTEEISMYPVKDGDERFLVWEQKNLIFQNVNGEEFVLVAGLTDGKLRAPTEAEIQDISKTDEQFSVKEDYSKVDYAKPLEEIFA